MCRSQILQIVSTLKTSYNAEGKLPQNTIFLLATDLEYSKGPMDELETFYIFYFYLFERKQHLKFRRKTTKSMNKIVNKKAL